MSDAGIGDNGGPALAVVLPPIPYNIGLSARVGVLNDLATALKTAGATITPIDRSASYDQSTVTRRLNDIITAVNTLGATPPLVTYSSTDYNAFTSIINGIVAGIGTIP